MLFQKMFIHDCYKDKEMYDNAGYNYAHAVRSVPGSYKT